MITAELREATKQLHEETERAVDLLPALQSLASYRMLLQRFFGFYAPLEALLRATPAPSSPLDIAARSKIARLTNDLIAIGLTPAEVAAIERCSRLPSIRSEADLLGAMYVLEGATLGGQIISRELKKRVDIDASKGGAFFAGYGANTREMWNGFCTAVNTFAEANPAASALIIAAATETFICFKEWIECRRK